ncbi:MAG: hypothetical protein R3F59_32315 [Myxococcota bacterium]
MSLVWLCATAWSFAPRDVPADSEVPLGLEPQRVLVTHPGEQGRLLAGEPFQRFLATDGAGWDARFDELHGTARYLWGRGIPLSGDGTAMADQIVALVERHAALFGVEPGSLRLRSAHHVDRTDTWYVDLDALRDGLPTFRGGLSARVVRGNLVLITAATAARAPVTGRFVLSEGSAVQRAIAGGPAPSAVHTDVAADQLLLERPDPVRGDVLRKVWRVRSATSDPLGRWVSFVDGETGELLSVHDEVRYLNGTIEGEHHERTVNGSPLVTSPMPLVQVTGSGGSATTDENGDYSLNGGGPYATDLDGAYVDVRNASGREGSLSGSSANLTWDSGDATQAEIDSYVFVNQVRLWGEQTAPEVAWVQGPVTSNVNLNQVCNAYFDGAAINFFVSGSGCNNTGQIADVNYHEWGHGFHYYSIEAGFFDGSLSEGAGDITAFLQTDDHLIGPYFLTNGGAVRDVGPDRRYPQDYVNNTYYVHENGLIFGGAFWDLLGLLQDDLGRDAGTVATSQIFAGTLKGGTDIPGSFYEALVSDDDDGDLENGTPHVCQIFDAFGRHGLGTNIGVDAVIASHEPLDHADPDEDANVEVSLVSIASGCDTVGARSAVVHYRVDGGSWDEEDLNTPGQRVEGAIPGQPAYSTVQYYITGVADDGSDFSVPPEGKVNPFSYYVGGTLEIRCDDFEDDDGGYESELVSGPGGDDWQWGLPAGQGGDPAGAFSGTHLWGTDIGLSGNDGLYQGNRVTRLESPRIDTEHYTGVFLQYRRWLRVQDGDFDTAAITVDDDDVWFNWKGPERNDDDTLDSGWVNHTVPLEGKADQTRFRLGFELRTNGSGNYGGWNIDDVCILAPDTPDNRLGITDLEAEPTSDVTVALTWTNPKHAPVERVRVVRKLGGFPESADDGEVVEEIDDVDVGDPEQVIDVNGHPGSTFYAVYGYDGHDWLSWTVEGWNAVEVDLVGGIVAPGDQWDTGGEDNSGLIRNCGCACDGTGGRSVGGALDLAIAGLIFLRRRRTVSAKVPRKHGR